MPLIFLESLILGLREPVSIQILQKFFLFFLLQDSIIPPSNVFVNKTVVVFFWLMPVMVFLHFQVMLVVFLLVLVKLAPKS